RKTGDGRADSNVVAWLSQADASSFFISVVTLMEIELGILLVERRDPSQGSRLRGWMDNQIRPEFADRTLSVDTRVALQCASLQIPDPRPTRDALIAATAMVHEMTVVTRNVRDFKPMKARFINPWSQID